MAKAKSNPKPKQQFKVVGSHRPPRGHKCSKWCGRVRCMCGERIHVEVADQPEECPFGCKGVGQHTHPDQPMADQPEEAPRG